MCIPWGGITIRWLQESADFLWILCQVTWLLVSRVTSEGEEAVLQYRTEKEQSLPLTGPMYITSEARVEKERVREKRTGQEWRDRYKYGMDGFNRTDEESNVRTVRKEKITEQGKPTALPGGLPTTQCRWWLISVFFRGKSLLTESWGLIISTCPFHPTRHESLKM